MKTNSYIIIITMFFMVYAGQAQEWSDRLTIIEAHFIEPTLIEIPESKSQIALLQDEGDALIFESKNFKTGINVMYEEDLESGFLIKDMLVYNIGLSYDFGRFSLGFMFENFLNVNQKEIEIQPNVEESFGVINALYFSQESPFLVAIGISFSL